MQQTAGEAWRKTAPQALFCLPKVIDLNLGDDERVCGDWL
jgi:hypothetical protein